MLTFISENELKPQLFVLSFAFFFFFWGYTTTQSYMVVEYGATGQLALTVIYACFATVSFFSPNIIAWTGPRAAMAAGSSGYLLLMIGCSVGLKQLILVGGATTGLGHILKLLFPCIFRRQ
jgi:hypothetical protein